MKEDEKKRVDFVVKLVLIIIIILLLLRNCGLQKEIRNYQNKPTPNGKGDVIEFKCNSCKCKKTGTQIESIEFAQEKISVKKGSTTNLILVIKPIDLSSSELTWESSNTNVAVVDSKGVLRAVGVGTVTITVTTAEGKTATCIVQVVAESVDAESIELSSDDTTIYVGSSTQIIAKISPENSTNHDLVWSSSDTSIATVDDKGIVTGVKQGTVTITAKTSDGKVVATITITVEEEGLVLDADETTIYVDSSAQITAKINQENVTNSDLIWSSSDTSIATVDNNGVVTGVKPGTVTITAKTSDGKYVGTITITVEEEVFNGDFDVFDDENAPITWNGSTNLDIFSKTEHTMDGKIAPESSGEYKFTVSNSTDYKLKYSISFIETNNYNINMKYRLKKNNTYIVSNYVSASDLNVDNVLLPIGENDVYTLEWKWISSSNDTSIGQSLSADYGLKIEVNAEGTND
ncbi:Ig domain-containing protein [bacterium]|nr:Ig domain-containing protein [bacterium]